MATLMGFILILSFSSDLFAGRERPVFEKITRQKQANCRASSRLRRLTSHCDKFGATTQSRNRVSLLPKTYAIRANS
jgi:hypothetical protein